MNVLWDGLVHAWLQDTMVATSARGEGIGRRLVEAAAVGARAAGCEILHVDFDEDLRPFYVDACGFRPSPGRADGPPAVTDPTATDVAGALDELARQEDFSGVVRIERGRHGRGRCRVRVGAPGLAHRQHARDPLALASGNKGSPPSP